MSDVVLDLFALPTQKFASAVLFKTLKGRDGSAKDELVDVLNKVVVKFLTLPLFVCQSHVLALALTQ